jgi:hypothetical protein
VSDFCDLTKSHKAVADGGVIEGDIPLLGSSIIIKKGHVFEDMSALKLWLQEYAVVHNRSYRVKNSTPKGITPSNAR